MEFKGPWPSQMDHQNFYLDGQAEELTGEPNVWDRVASPEVDLAECPQSPVPVCPPQSLCHPCPSPYSLAS